MRLGWLFGAGAIAIVVAACSGKSASSDGKLCTPGAYVYCRCQNKDEGTKLCHDDGQGFDACLPCEGDIPETPPGETPPSEEDAGDDAPITKPATCGDKIVQQDEDCDDGNTEEQDGCNSSCRLEGSNPLPTRSCPGLDVHVWGTRAVTLSSTTAGAPNSVYAEPACPSGVPTSGSVASDRLFHLTAHKTGLMTVTTSDTNFDNWMYVADSCFAGENTYISCSNAVAGAGGETLAFPVEAGKSYTLIVDGVSTAQGAFKVTFSIN